MQSGEQTLLSVSDLSVEYRLSGLSKPLRAVDGVSFDVNKREVFGLIGESGSGKSSVARAVMRLSDIASGEITLSGQNIAELKGKQLRKSRHQMQMVFQDPNDSLNPRMTLRKSIYEPLLLAGKRSRAELNQVAVDLLSTVGLDEDLLDRKPHGLSGGQKQRVNIVRALALKPDLLVCDEAVSALDVSVQAGIINLLMQLQKDLGISIIFISHDISVVSHLSDRIGVMYFGKIVEIGSAESLTDRPRHPYTEALLAAELEPLPSSETQKRHQIILGEVPSADRPSVGCRFAARCPYAKDLCLIEEPQLLPLADGTSVACHFAQELSLKGRRA